ncbi:helix-turn-helix domain-containing protein [Streptomyces pseudoechinosporeus]
MAGHPNFPLTPEGRRRLHERVAAGRPIAHVAAEAGMSRRCLAKWYARWQAHGEDGLLDHFSRPASSPSRSPEDIADLASAAAADQARAHSPCRRPQAAAWRHGRASHRVPHSRAARTQPPA